MKPPKMHQFPTQNGSFGVDVFFLKTQPIFGSLRLWSTLKSRQLNPDLWELCCHIWGVTLQSSKIDMTKRSSFERREQDNFSDTQMVEGQSASWTGERFAEDLEPFCQVLLLVCWVCTSENWWWHAKGWSWYISPLGQPQKLCCFLAFLGLEH